MFRTKYFIKRIFVSFSRCGVKTLAIEFRTQCNIYSMQIFLLKLKYLQKCIGKFSLGHEARAVLHCDYHYFLNSPLIVFVDVNRPVKFSLITELCGLWTSTNTIFFSIKNKNNNNKHFLNHIGIYPPRNTRIVFKSIQ